MSRHAVRSELEVAPAQGFMLSVVGPTSGPGTEEPSHP